MPLYITTDDTDTGFDHGFAGAAGDHMPGLETSGTNMWHTVHAARDYLISELSLDIRSVVYLGFGPFFVITLDSSAERNHLPMRLGKAWCEYRLHTESEPNQGECAHQLVDLKPGDVDDSEYTPHLRPGIMLCCGGAPDDRRTTSGVAIRKKEDHSQRFVTVASHGFPIGQETVYHPVADRAIGEVSYRLGDTDVAMASIKPGLTYVNETFESPDRDAQRITMLSGSVTATEFSSTPHLVEQCAVYSLVLRLRVLKAQAIL
ncbi:hypothetical protein VTN96DRAFT_7019 [Rasamsonia emersonii]|uniref:Uncharacterized protein n=1 Tax=Rasamsonia emersonii (strain ATCC 16479 / CBS 393.64 / IMI 116815) TaxID=1408163 RepID=A0A0F4Z0R8_RASE3|nr:hypothetical protein T310_2309 [Rasamsonia emersonii CBS 393.64]KKA23656.1 hypothetical protein T310_2309 [Rasamsonia emersonii CBS 393.64]